MNNILTNTDWSLLFSIHNINLAVQVFHKIILDIIDNLAAKIYPYHCKFPPWFSQKLRLLINEKTNSTKHLKYRVIVIHMQNFQI